MLKTTEVITINELREWLENEKEIQESMIKYCRNKIEQNPNEDGYKESLERRYGRKFMLDELLDELERAGV